jgi:hypothetical protein
MVYFEMGPQKSTEFYIPTQWRKLKLPDFSYPKKTFGRSTADSKMSRLHVLRTALTSAVSSTAFA